MDKYNTTIGRMYSYLDCTWLETKRIGTCLQNRQLKLSNSCHIDPPIPHQFFLCLQNTHLALLLTLVQLYYLESL